MLAVPIGWLIGAYLGGFGVPVAARVVIGLLMVPAFFAIILVATSLLWGLRDRLRWREGLSTLRGGERTVRPDAAELIDRMQDWDRSTLVRVVGIGRAVESEGTTVEFLALELRGEGGAITLRASGARIASGPSLPPWPKLSVSDDRGTLYLVIPGGGGGGGEGSMQYELRFAPGPPTGARTLDLAVIDFSQTPWAEVGESDGAGQPAPWHVTVDLR